ESDSEYGEMDDLGKLALQIDNIIREKCKVDWHNNTDVHNQIAQEIDDIIFYYTDKTGIKLTFDDIDKIIEKVKNIAFKRY
ncbi:hypothetical protein, partial [Clostridioides difficile]|uniref:hypothetical protein n=1 Tax=Clostridioides difficile TaxID=1496 RepID=UPI0023581B69